jgi:hypothetical protein
LIASAIAENWCPFSQVASGTAWFPQTGDNPVVLEKQQALHCEL